MPDTRMWLLGGAGALAGLWLLGGDGGSTGGATTPTTTPTPDSTTGDTGATGNYNPDDEGTNTDSTVADSAQENVGEATGGTETTPVNTVSDVLRLDGRDPSALGPADPVEIDPTPDLAPGTADPSGGGSDTLDAGGDTWAGQGPEISAGPGTSEIPEGEIGGTGGTYFKS